MLGQQHGFGNLGGDFRLIQDAYTLGGIAHTIGTSAYGSGYWDQAFLPTHQVSKRFEQNMPYGRRGRRTYRRRRYPIRRRVYHKRYFRPGFHRTSGGFRNFGSGRELKFFDTAITDAAVGNGGTIQVSPNLVVQGTTLSQRIGAKCTVRSFSLKYCVYLDAVVDQADIPNGDTLRMLIYIDKQTNGSAAAILDVLQAADWQAHRSVENMSRFRTLLDIEIPMNRMVSSTDGTNTASSPEVVVCGKWFKKLNLPLSFKGTTGAISEIRTNNLGILLISQNGLCRFDGTARIRFTG